MKDILKTNRPASPLDDMDPAQSTAPAPNKDGPTALLYRPTFCASTVVTTLGFTYKKSA